MITETWRAVVGFSNYEVSDLGRVRSLSRKGARGGFLTPYVKRSPSGRPVCAIVNLRRFGKTQTRRVHHLVLDAFVGPCPDGLEGCHENGDPTVNRLGNLRWDTHASNVEDMLRHGHNVDPPVQARGSNTRTWLSEDDARCIAAEPHYRGVCQMLGRAFGVSYMTAYRIRKAA